MFIIKDSTDGQFVFTIVGKNSHTLLTSETYKRKENARKGIKAICRAFGMKYSLSIVEDHTIPKNKNRK